MRNVMSAFFYDTNYTRWARGDWTQEFFFSLRVFTLRYTVTVPMTSFIQKADAKNFRRSVFNEKFMRPDMETVEDVARSLQNFGWSDYCVFGLMLLSCIGIGIYFSHRDAKRKKSVGDGSEALEYLVGGRKMKVFPVSMSLVASMMSGIGLLGTSTEIYVYGSGYMFMLVALVLAGVALHYFFLPVYLDLRLTSMYEYLDCRFNRSLRLFGSSTYLLSTVRKGSVMYFYVINCDYF